MLNNIINNKKKIFVCNKAILGSVPSSTSTSFFLNKSIAKSKDNFESS